MGDSVSEVVARTVEVESGGSPLDACLVADVGRRPSHTDEKGTAVTIINKVGCSIRAPLHA